jgi:hypothetical protein
VLAGNQPVVVRPNGEQPKGPSISDWIAIVVEYASGAMYAVVSVPALTVAEGLTGSVSPLPVILLLMITGDPLQFDEAYGCNAELLLHSNFDAER